MIIYASCIGYLEHKHRKWASAEVAVMFNGLNGAHYENKNKIK